MIAQHYAVLRWRVYRNEVKLLLHQMRQLGVLIVAIMGTALPAIFFFAALALGIILEDKQEGAATLALIWFLLVLQTLWLGVFKPAILASRYRIYMASLHIPNILSRAVSTGLSVFAQPMFVLLIAILLSTPVSQWSQAKHGFALLALQSGLTFMVMKKPKSLPLFLTLSLLYLLAWHFVFPFWQITLSTLQHIFAWCLLLFCTSLLKPRLTFFRYQTPALFQLWLSYVKHYWPSVTLFFGLNIVVALLASISIPQLLEYQHEARLAGLLLTVLISSAAQLPVTRFTSEHSLYFRDILTSKVLASSEYAISVITATLSFTIFAVLNNAMHWLVLFIACYGVCLLTAKQYKNGLFLVWCGVAVLCFATQ